MTPTEFSAPSFDPAALDTQVGSADQIDLNDPALLSESLDVNPDADAYASPPPPPDGVYRVKLKQIDVKDGNGNAVRFRAAKAPKDGQVYVNTAIEARIIDAQTGKYDNIPLYDYWVGTYRNRDGSTKLTTILNKLGVAIPRGASHKSLMDLFLQTLAGEPEIEVETAWEASCQTCSTDYKAGKLTTKPREIKGMARFPQVNNIPVPEIPCPLDAKHGVMVAQARIVGFRSLKK